MFRQLSAVLSAAVLLSGCGIMQSSKDLVRSTTPWPASPIPTDNGANGEETSTPKFMLDDAKHIDDFFALLAETANEDSVGENVDNQSAAITTSDDDDNMMDDNVESKSVDIAMSDDDDSMGDTINNESADIAINDSDENNSTDAGMVTSDDNSPAVSNMDRYANIPSADNTPNQSFADVSSAKNTVFFEFGSNELNINGQVLLDNFVEQLGNSDLVELTGYTCNIGPENVNQYLSKNRAQSVKAYLMYKGVDESRIVTEGRGVENPAASNSDKITRMINRRVEMRIAP